MRAGERSTGHLKVNLHSHFAAIQLSSLDDLPSVIPLSCCW